MEIFTLEDKVKGCLIGCAIGAELGFARIAQPERFCVKSPAEVFSLELGPVTEYEETPYRINFRKVTPFIDLGVQAYIQKQGRVTPEDFGRLLQDDTQLAEPVFMWDGIHSVIELLKEGMHPRLSGLGIAPCGNICAAMPAVGIYHCGDPEYAYLDGVELAAVAQPRVGADWAGLCAAAIACAFQPHSTAECIVNTVLKLAHQNNKELFYVINHRVRHSRWMQGSEEQFLNWWLHTGGRDDSRKESNWIANNPIGYVLPLLEPYGSDAHKLMAVLLAPQCNGALVNAVIAGAIWGALNGAYSFPEKWQHCGAMLAKQWFPMVEVVRKQLTKEQEIIVTAERLAATKPNGTSLLFEKVYGCLLAGAIGNAMGSVVEGMFYWEIDEQYPGGIQTVLDPRRLEGEDDNQMAMHLVETYIERDGLPVMARHFGMTWKERLNRDHFYPHCMGNAYDLICAGWDPRITGHWSVVTGSTVMCMEPVGVYHLCDAEYAEIDARAVSYMYQRGLDVAAATMLAATVAEAFQPDATVDSVCQAALRAAPKEPLRTFDQRQYHSAYEYIETCLAIAEKYDDVLAAREELYEKCLFYHMIDPLELWGFALAMFRIAQGDVRQAAIGGTNIGRDSDTIAGRAAMLSGALKGVKSVPEDWIALFSPHTLERIEHNARRFAEMVFTRKLPRIKQRQMLHTQ